jgi:hypothetical protein
MPGEYDFRLPDVTKMNIGTYDAYYEPRRSCDDAFSCKRPVTRGSIGLFKRSGTAE